MTSPPSPPNRRRRRIVVGIVVLVLGLGWWFWPRVDQRFVGTWKIFDMREKEIGIARFDANGQSWFDYFDSGKADPMAWTSTENQIVFGRLYLGGEEFWITRMRVYLQRLQPRVVIIPEYRCDAAFGDSDTIDFRFDKPSNGGSMTLRRLRE